MVKEARYSELVNCCWDYSKSLSEVQVHCSNENQTACKLRVVLSTAKRLLATGTSIVEFIKQFSQSCLKCSELKAEFETFQIDFSELGRDLAEQKVKKLYSSLKLREESLQDKLNVEFNDFSNKITQIQEDLSKKYKILKANLESKFQKDAVELFFKTNVFDHIKGIQIRPNTESLSQVTGEWSCLSADGKMFNKRVKRVIFEDQLQKVQCYCSLGIEIEDDHDRFYASLLSKKMSRVYYQANTCEFFWPFVGLFRLDKCTPPDK